jgi:soluble lytic murein transglycosylase
MAEIRPLIRLCLVRQARLGQKRRMKNLKSIPRVLTLLGAMFMAPSTTFADENDALRTALGHAAAKDWAAALTAATDAGEVGRDVIIWQWLRASEGKLGDYEQFLARRSDWPGLPLLKEKGEVAVARSTDSARVLAYFGVDRPRTGAGAVALVQAMQSLGRDAEAEDEATRAWSELKFEPKDEAALSAIMGAQIAVAHEVRLDRILWEGERSGEASRMLDRVSPDFRALAQARIALQGDKPNAPQLVSAVPDAYASDPGLAYDRFAYRMRNDRYDDARDLIIERSQSAIALGVPQAWAERRATLARYLMRNNQPKAAYQIAANHFLIQSDSLADLEFLAGFIALRKLDNPDRALQHFTTLKASVATPISLARAHYWIARALEAKGDASGATAAYQAAAQNQTAYYGLLAAEKLGLSLDEKLLSEARPNADWRQSGFARASVLEAAMRLARAGDRALSKRFFLHLGESLDAQELEVLADLAFEMQEPHIAVLIAKAAAERAIILPRAYFPVSRALALSISRRESEFDPNAQSSAGARGLMQVLPATASDLARKTGEDSSAQRLITDPAFNVRMGSAYLRQMADEFGPSIALIASGYNAGPGRPRKWVKDFGDPRRGGVDVVDWVEMIPFTETRTYVMRVAEGVVIYRAKLNGQGGPVNIRSELTGN